LAADASVGGWVCMVTCPRTSDLMGPERGQRRVVAVRTMKRRLFPRMMSTVAIAICTGLVALGCGGDPEAGSGGDAYRSEAQPIPFDELVTDSLSLEEFDRTDWKAIDLDYPGRLAIAFSADEAEAESVVALFDRYGTRLSAAEPSGGKISTLTVDVPRGGRYFLMVQAVDGPPTAYSIQVSLGDTPTHKDVPAGRPGF
jgi:hypothetical protein